MWRTTTGSPQDDGFSAARVGIFWDLVFGIWDFEASWSLELSPNWFTLCSFPGMTGSRPHSSPVLTEDLWQILFTQAFLFATKYINRLRWRGTFGGVLPDGDDAESIAAQAVTDFLLSHPGHNIRHQQREGPVIQQSINPSIHVPNNPPIHHPESDAPLIHHPLAPLIQQSSNRLLPRSISSSLSRLVWRHIDRLHHRSENLLLRNEADLAPAYIDADEVCRFIETIPDAGGNPYNNLVHKETTAEFEALQTEFRKFLGRERGLKSLFACYANGIWQPRDVASRLHLSASTTRNLQKRLKRRFQRFLEQQSHAE